MVQYNKFTLDNGLRVVVHEDPTTPLVAVNTLYNVGARDEQEDKTGFAHLFEHLMFEGSANIPNFDEPLQRAGGESNAFTNNDMTNYYDVIPAGNLETALWLESDRMLQLDITAKSLDVQRKVVIEEFKENYLNQPYGDVWHKLSELAYKVHPYKWPTIGKEISHIENATLKDVKSFFNTYYVPANAILVIAGSVKTEEVRELVEKWFGDIPYKPAPIKQIAKEPKQTEARLMEVQADVQANAIYKAYHMDIRDSHNYYVMDLVTDILSSGHSARLYQSLIKEQELFSEIDAYVSSYFDEGLIIIEGKMRKGVTMEQADNAIAGELLKLRKMPVGVKELQKIKNKQESYTVFSEVNLLNRATNLAYCELLGNIELINTEIDIYNKINVEDIAEESEKVFTQTNCSTIHYYAKNN
ncbi:MAG: pitrilysin family protein [Chitinophagales bacterium]|nr:pitrilysin family protein [Chitinophagales bacterium]